MEEYREKLKNQNLILTICILILASFSLLGFASEAGWISLAPVAGDSHWQSMWLGFVSGASTGILLLMTYGLVRNLAAMKDGKKLKKLYIKEHDERSIQVWTCARAAAMQAFLLLGLAAAIAAGYFSIAVSLTILACVVFCSLICSGMKVYYSKKF